MVNNNTPVLTVLARWMRKKMVILIPFCLIPAVLGIYRAYEENNNYWKWCFGELGNVSESAFLTLFILGAVCLRCVVFPSQRAPRSRNQPAFWWTFAGFAALDLTYYLFHARQAYRYDPDVYFASWGIVMAPAIASYCEVIIALFIAYSPKQLTKEGVYKGLHGLEDLNKRLQDDTNGLVWIIAIMTYFFIGAFKDYYLPFTAFMSMVLMGLVLVISATPWLLARKYVGQVLEPYRSRYSTARSISMHAIDRVRGEIPWSRRKERIESAEWMLSRIDSLEKQYDFLSWLSNRRKDLLPVIALQVVTPILEPSTVLKYLKSIL